MKTKFVRFFVNIWLVLSEVPGWPDAPVLVRLRRVAPMLIAFAGIAALLGWSYGWRNPEIREVRAAHDYLVVLEAEVAALRLEHSDQRATEIAEQARLAAVTLVDSPDVVAPLLHEVREKIRALGWEAVFQTYDSVTSDADAVDGVRFAAARARLVPIEGNPAPFKTLLGVFDQFSATDKRIDLTRLGIRADDTGTLEVEMNLRVACRAAHEKAS